MNFSEDFLEFLSRGEELKCNFDNCIDSKINVFTLDELSMTEIYLHRYIEGQDGYIAIPAVKLMPTFDYMCHDYWFIWLPNERVYGLWAYHDWELMIYPNLTWTEFCKEPYVYINCEADLEYAGVGVNYNPQDCYDVKLGRPDN